MDRYFLGSLPSGPTSFRDMEEGHMFQSFESFTDKALKSQNMLLEDHLIREDQSRMDGGGSSNPVEMKLNVSKLTEVSKPFKANVTKATTNYVVTPTKKIQVDPIDLLIERPVRPEQRFTAVSKINEAPSVDSVVTVKKNSPKVNIQNLSQPTKAATNVATIQPTTQQPTAITPPEKKRDYTGLKVFGVLLLGFSLSEATGLTNVTGLSKAGKNASLNGVPPKKHVKKTASKRKTRTPAKRQIRAKKKAVKVTL